MLLSDMEIGVSNLSWQYEPIVCQAFALSQGLELLRAKHTAERIRCIYGTINEYVCDVDTL